MVQNTMAGIQPGAYGQGLTINSERTSYFLKKEQKIPVHFMRTIAVFALFSQGFIMTRIFSKINDSTRKILNPSAVTEAFGKA